MAGPEHFRVDGLRELEKSLKILRDTFDVKTGGVIIRGLRAGAKLIRDEARRRVTHVPSGFATLYAAPTDSGTKRKGRKGKVYASLEALLRANIVEHAQSRFQGDRRPTVLIRVRSHGYDRVSGRLRFKRPGSSPGWWWWMEFGTSKTPARPFMRPAVEAMHSAAVEKMRQTVASEIDQLFKKHSRAA